MDIVDGMYKEVTPSPPLPVTHIYTPLIVQGMDIVDGMYKEVSYITYTPIPIWHLFLLYISAFILSQCIFPL